MTSEMLLFSAYSLNPMLFPIFPYQLDTLYLENGTDIADRRGSIFNYTSEVQRTSE